MALNKNIIKRLVQVFLTLVIQGLILFLSAGTFSWTWAWIFLSVGVVILIINLNVLPAEVIEERGRSKWDAKKWDKIITSLNIFPTLLMYICCGLDYRFFWTGEVGLFIQVLGLVLYFLASLLFTWAMVSNKFFSTLVRLQTERNHTVATGGPYRFLRHPGYLGYILMTLATPVALGVLWGLVFAPIIVILLIIRTILEDKTLKKELGGYAEYADQVKYKLIPFLW